MTLIKIRIDSVKLTRLIFFIVLLIIFSVEITAKNKNIFSNPNLGFEITKLDSWYFVSPKTSIESAKQAKTRKELAITKASVPVVTIATKSDTSELVYPSLEVRANSLRGFEGLKPVQVMEVLISKYKNIFFDVKIMKEPTEKNISGYEASYFSLNSTHHLQDGRSFPIYTEHWFIFANNIYFTITSSLLQNENQAVREEIKKIIDSLKIE